MSKLEKKYKNKSPGIIRRIKGFCSSLFYYLKFIVFIILIIIITQIYIEQKRLNLDFLQNQFISFSSKHGFILQNVYLEGQEYTSSEDILKALKIEIGDPIFKVSVNEIKENLEKIDWVKTAVVDREFPSNLYIGLSERVPIGIGQHNKILFLFDEDGKKINEKNLAPFLQLPVVISEDLGLFINDLYIILAKDKELYSKVTSAVRISERRWNIRFQNEIEVKLPEYNIEEAWDRLVLLNKNNQLLNDNITSIDLRIPNKIFVEKKR